MYFLILYFNLPCYKWYVYVPSIPVWENMVHTAVISKVFNFLSQGNQSNLAFIFSWTVVLCWQTIWWCSFCIKTYVGATPLWPLHCVPLYSLTSADCKTFKHKKQPLKFKLCLPLLEIRWNYTYTQVGMCRCCEYDIGCVMKACDVPTTLITQGCHVTAL